MSKVSEFIRLMFESRQVAHKAHLMTSIDARHRALGSFYEGIVDLADGFAEAYIGRYGKIADLDFSAQDEDADEVVAILRRHMEWIEINRSLIAKNQALQSMIDDILVHYMQSLYKLENLM
jgi:hypothetical protein